MWQACLWRHQTGRYCTCWPRLSPGSVITSTGTCALAFHLFNTIFYLEKKKDVSFTRLFILDRVVYIFGPVIHEEIRDVTPTFLSPDVLSKLRLVDDIANRVLHSTGETSRSSRHQFAGCQKQAAISTTRDVYFVSGYASQLSQMPIVLLPIHFDRDPAFHVPSCQHSVVIRTFLTADFMTGIAALPDKHLPAKVLDVYCFVVTFMSLPARFILLPNLL